MIMCNHICPYCYVIYSQEEIDDDPECFDCGIEGLTSTLVHVDSFFVNNLPEDLDEAKARIQRSDRHCPSRKEQIYERIDLLKIDLKKFWIWPFDPIPNLKVL